MSQPAWFGLSHDRAWGDVGQSFADLNSRDGHLEACKTATGETAAAGTRSSAKPKGAGSFQLQVDMLLRYSRLQLDTSQICAGMLGTDGVAAGCWTSRYLVLH